MDVILEFLSSVIGGLIDVLTILAASFINGIQFFVSALTAIPSFIFDILQGLPSFIEIGLTGVFGLLLLVVFLKIFALVKLS